ncbi:peptidase C39 family protein [Streptomyces sp. A7024]|uniref:Peptidase C39 family protein n=1 Tax=Streptomyces coryli TaxID=1128680 RepID=A0A6G4U421_9ACTN|nr:peptidase C39 family protein [Streptomyces coryli]NGN66118.1 peptidase C39 family protein [Streptomyces coryli]
MSVTPTRRTVLAAAVAAAAGSAFSSSASASVTARPRGATAAAAPIDFRGWHTAEHWAGGTADGTKVLTGTRPGIAIDKPTGTLEYKDPHAKKSTRAATTWEYATWTAPAHTLATPATEAIASWNADTPAGTWVQVELQGSYSDGTKTPWYVMARWSAGDTAADIRRTSVDGQSDDKSAISTDTFAISDPSSGLRLTTAQLRLTLCRTPGTTATPTVWRAGVMGSAIPDRFTVPASQPGVAAGKELAVPRYSQEIHAGQYPEYDGGGEAWCSPTSSTMILEFWDRKPTPEDLAWVNPDYADPQVCHAARYVYDYQYEGCGNWPFNAAYASTYTGMNGAITRLATLNDIETLVAAGLPPIVSMSFLENELTGAGYGTAGHIMTVIGFTADGNVIANDPASQDNPSVRHIYNRAQFETIWLRTKRKNAAGETVSGPGGVTYVYWPTDITAAQQAALQAVGVI